MKALDRDLTRSRLRRVRRELVTLRPAPYAEHVAIRAATCLAIVLTALWATGHVALGLPASFGIISSIYGGRTPTPRRWRIQVRHAGLLGLAVLSGALAGLSVHRYEVAVGLGVAWAVVGAVLSDRQRWIPPGPMFPVFAAVSCAAIPMTGSSVVGTAIVFSGSAVLAIGLGALEARWLEAEAPPTPSGVHPASNDPGRQHVQALRCGAAVLVAGLLGLAAGGRHPYWAMPACLVPLSVAGVSAQLARGLNRTLGTLVGLPLSALLIWLPVPLLARLLLVAVVQGIVELLVGRHYGLAMVFITPLALVLGHVAAPQPVSELLRDRTVETVIGAVVGVAVAVLTRPRRPAT